MMLEAFTHKTALTTHDSEHKRHSTDESFWESRRPDWPDAAFVRLSAPRLWASEDAKASVRRMRPFSFVSAVWAFDQAYLTRRSHFFISQKNVWSSRVGIL